MELKAVDKPNPLYLAQVITYLKLTDCPAGLLLNLNCASLREGLHRLNHPQLHGASTRIDRFTRPAEQPEAMPARNQSGSPEPSDR